MFSRACCLSVLLSLALFCGSCSRPQPPAADSVKSIADAYWEFYLRNNPELGTQSGEYRYNDQLSEFSIAHNQAVKKDATALLARLRALDPTRLGEADRLDHAVLLGALEDQVRSIDLKMYEMPI